MSLETYDLWGFQKLHWNFLTLQKPAIYWINSILIVYICSLWWAKLNFNVIYLVALKSEVLIFVLNGLKTLCSCSKEAEIKQHTLTIYDYWVSIQLKWTNISWPHRQILWVCLRTGCGGTKPVLAIFFGYPTHSPQANKTELQSIHWPVAKEMDIRILHHAVQPECICPVWLAAKWKYIFEMPVQTWQRNAI